MDKIINNLKISAITPSYNQGVYIKDTLNSVKNQHYSNYEHLVIDGGSTDNTLSILQEFHNIKYISEPDKGQSDAINKGLALASGDIIAWINSDDWYEPDIFHKVNSFFCNNPDKMIVMGDCNLTDSQGKVFNKICNRERGYKEIRRYWVGCSIPTQPAIFFRKELIDDIDYLDESLHYAMDYDLWLRFSKAHKFYRLNATAANYRFHPEAKGGDQNWSKFELEWKAVYKKHVGIFDQLTDFFSKFSTKESHE